LKNNVANILKQIPGGLSKRPSLVYLILSLFFGIFFIFHLAPLSGTDEFTHFPRVYQISEGRFWEKRLPANQFGGNLPVNLNNMINQYRNLTRISPGHAYIQTEETLNEHYSSVSQVGHKKVAAIFTSVILYPPWAYIGSLIGVILAKIMHLPLIWYVYMGRLSTLVVWVILTYLAIRIIPFGKWFMVALALLPTSLTQAATISADGLLSGISWLLIALVLAIIAKTLKPNWWRLLLISLLSIFVGLIKDGYFLIGLIPLAIPSSVFSNKKLGKIWQLCTALVVIVASVLFTLRTVHADNGVVLTPTIGMYFNSHLQIEYILHHIFSFGIRVLIQPFTKTFDTTYLGVVGIITNRLIYLSIMVIFSLYVGLYIGLRQIGTNQTLVTNRKRLVIVFIAIFILTYGLLASAFYIGNTSVGATFVNGFYGRYFLPMIPLVLVIPMTIKRKLIRRDNLYATSITVIATIGLIATLTSLR